MLRYFGLAEMTDAQWASDAPPPACATDQDNRHELPLYQPGAYRHHDPVRPTAATMSEPCGLLFA